MKITQRQLNMQFYIIHENINKRKALHFMCYVQAELIIEEVIIVENWK